MNRNNIRTSYTAHLSKGQSASSNVSNGFVWIDFHDGNKMTSPLAIFLPENTNPLIAAKIAALLNEALS